MHYNSIVANIVQGYRSIIKAVHADNDDGYDSVIVDTLTSLGDEIVASLNGGFEPAPTLQWLISACIASGIDSRDHIVRFVKNVSNFSARHIGWQLGEAAGHDECKHLWLKADDGRYRLHHRSPIIHPTQLAAGQMNMAAR